MFSCSLECVSYLVEGFVNIFSIYTNDKVVNMLRRMDLSVLARVFSRYACTLELELSALGALIALGTLIALDGLDVACL